MSQIKIRCRAVIIHEGKLLVVQHSNGDDWFTFPGGHLDFGEDPQECIQREVTEELGIKPTIGRLLYVYSFIGRTGAQSVEFFFEVTNGEDFTSLEGKEASHASEIAEIVWVSSDTGMRILPEEISNDFKKGTICADTPRFIKV